MSSDSSDGGGAGEAFDSVDGGVGQASDGPGVPVRDLILLRTLVSRPSASMLDTVFRCDMVDFARRR